MPNQVNIEKKGILNKKEYVGPADVWPADDIPFCSISPFFQYSLIHDLAPNVGNLWHFNSILMKIVVGGCRGRESASYEN